VTTQTAIVEYYASQTLGGTVHHRTTDALIATADTVTELTADGAVYAFVFGEASVIAAGSYRLKILDGSDVVGTRIVEFAGVNNEVAETVGDLWERRSAAILVGTLTGAGTATNVFTSSALGITVTSTVDIDGNRSAVVFS
jgi:hypothetical protein